ncbi:MAG: FG-GAP-like repeat-containing protein [Terriglobales bacterium]
MDLGRRDFLFRCCQGASTALIPAGLRGLGWPTINFAVADTMATCGEFQLHPQYRVPRPLDALLLKAQSGLDDFPTERYADQIGAILSAWSSRLLESPQDVKAIAEVLLPNFLGASLSPAESRTLRPGPAIVVHSNRFSREAKLNRETFLLELRSSLSRFSKLLTAEFQVTSIDAVAMSAGSAAATQIQTRIRYELLGTGSDCYREQRVGYWDLIWERSASDAFRLLRWAGLEETRSVSQSPGYVDITTAALGANASHASQLMHGSDYWRTVLDGACGIDIYGHNGVSVGDVDGDGFDDLYVCQPGGLPNRLYRNRGDGTFEDITESAGVGVLENTACALIVDVDNDGRQDLIVVRSTGPMLFLNEGGGKFRQKANAFQFANPPQGTFTGAAAADYDRDGWLDIYFCLYVYYQGTDQYKYPSPYYDAENGPPNFMMRNQGDGTFRDVTAETGLNQNNTRYSFCCGWNDFNRDGWADLYVVNDFGRKNLYRNNGDGTFTDVAAQAKVEDIGAGMSVCWFDYNNDGDDDLYVANMWTAAGERISMQGGFQRNAPPEARALYHKHAMGNSLLRGTVRDERHDAFAFEDATMAAGVGIGRWAWSSDAWDFDHDGFPDLYIANGMVTGPSREDLNSFFWRQVVAHSPDEAKPSQNYEQGWSAINELIRADGTWSGYERNVFYANNGDGTFSDISGVIDLDFLEDGRAFALADFDHDGRQELFLKNRSGPQLRLLKNVMESLPPSIAFRLRGTKSNRDAIGAIVTIETEAGRQRRSLQAGSGFLSQHSKEVFFGLGAAKGLVRASIRWPSGLVQELHDLPINHRVWIEEGAEPSRVEAFRERRVERLAAPPSRSTAQAIETLPDVAETWLLAPVKAPDFSLPQLDGTTRTLSSFRGKAVLLHFWDVQGKCKEGWNGLNQRHSAWASKGFHLLSVNLDSASDAERVRTFVREHHLSFDILRGSDDVAAVYNIVYRFLFDRHRDLALPTSFLINPKGEIVKIYQGPVNPEQIEHDFQHIPENTAERLARALPFPGVTDAIEFGRNYLSYGSIFFQRGYMDQAAASFQIALRDDPASAEALYGIGSVYLNLQKSAEARESFERALKLRASYPDTMANSWNNLGLLAARDGWRDEAIEYFQEALKLSPDHSIALDNLGSAYRQQKQWDNARQTYDRALKVNPNDAEANYGLGMVFAQNDETERAFNLLQTALKLRPGYPEALNNLGILYLRTQRRDQAVATFEECMRVAPAFDQAYLNLAQVYDLEGTPEKARKALLELLKQHPGHAQAQEMLNRLGQ